jgi:peptidoglycan/LPS O-acetylase OafA/YrhL
MQPRMTTSQNRGRFLLAAAFLLLGVFLINGLLSTSSKDAPDLQGGAFGVIIGILALILAFRGSQLAMKLTKGCLFLCVTIIVFVIIIVSISLVSDAPIPAALTPTGTISLVAACIGLAFSTWAVFLSKDVREFIRFQDEISYQKQLNKIKQK